MIFGDAGLVTGRGKQLKFMSISSMAVQVFFTETVCGSNTFCAFPPATVFTVKQGLLLLLVGSVSSGEHRAGPFSYLIAQLSSQ